MILAMVLTMMLTKSLTMILTMSLTMILTRLGHPHSDTGRPLRHMLHHSPSLAASYAASEVGSASHCEIEAV